MKRLVFGMLALSAGMMLIASPAVSQPPGEKGGKDAKGDGKGGEKGGGGRGSRPF